MPDQALIEEFSQKVLEKPEVFLNKSEASAEQAKAITKYLYDLGTKKKNLSVRNTKTGSNPTPFKYDTYTFFVPFQ